MNKDNLFYYQKEIAYLHETRELFIKKYPKLAPFLAYDSKDPDVERMIENLAVLTSKIHQEMDQNIPYIAESLINIISPNYTSPLPSLCMQEFSFDKNNKDNYAFIPKGTYVKSSATHQCECLFKTIYDVHLYPLVIENASISNERQFHTLNLSFKVSKENINLSEIHLEKLMLYLGDDVYISSTLLMYFHLYLHQIKVVSLDTNEIFRLNIYDICRMGLNPEESCLSYNELGFEAFSLLREYFFIPEKFNFICIKGLEILQNCMGKRFTIEFKFTKPFPEECVIRKELFSTSITPIVNVFEKSAEPIIYRHNNDGERIFIDRSKPDSYEILSIKQVRAHNSDSGRRILKNYHGFERFRFLQESENEFYATANKRNSKGETYKVISFFSETNQIETITIDALCCNKNLPSTLKIGDINSCNLPDIFTKNIKIPSIMRSYKTDGNLLWKLVSILSFSYQTMLDKTSFFSVLESYSFADDRENLEAYAILRESIIKIQSKSTYLVDEQIIKKGTMAIFFIKDSNFYSLGEVYRLGLILSKFLSSFASINSFCELKIKCLDSNEILYYPASFGKKAIL
ncbi:type VI secretion system baseplate subunit TssF [Helicobacter sp. MIT 05-5294]|uniref:type VI secretion system baseplate subunit TssF n=1 Tax=Helicobacter sp. MIT 05-5294 TaxID=1548150 RepID=UPI00051FD753|nr:type VI secretion system baseplate subunit TssF [Helicobacter sp. MIT 05-5294]TLD86754.1 type VI secretion system baseplate subunit TssF [Helicobacter sp. MIT 05-5294]